MAGPQHQVKPAASLHVPLPVRVGSRESRAGNYTAKATEGALDPGVGAEELPGVRGAERSEGRRGNWRDPPRPRVSPGKLGCL